MPFGTISLWVPRMGDQTDRETFQREFAGEEWWEGESSNNTIVIPTEDRFVEVLERMQELGLPMMYVEVSVEGEFSPRVLNALDEAEVMEDSRF